jgi:parallel beta-helix repeat protein
MRAVYLVNPVEPDDGSTTSNDISNNTIEGAQYGMVARRSQTNALSDNNFAGNITSAHYFLTGNSTFGITNQTFSDTEIRGRDGQNIVGIASSGVITIDNETRVNTSASAFTRILTNQTLVVNSTNSAPR